MRRNDRVITDHNRIESFLNSEQILRVAFYEEGDIYIVPVNYGYSHTDNKYSFYFHGAKAGRKYELTRKEPTVGFEIDGSYKLLEGESACDYSASFQSVIGTGRLHLIETDDEKIKGLNAVMKQAAHRAEWTYSREMLRAVAVFQLDVETISCKAN